MAEPASARSTTPLLSLGILAASALAISAGSTGHDPLFNALGLAAASAGLVVFALRERASGVRVLPRGATDPKTRLGATYFVMILMLVGVNTEIFVPYFLQTLQGLSPLHAGYMSALMSGGWSVGSVSSAAIAPGSRGVRLVLGTGPLILATSLALLCVFAPVSGGTPGLAIIGLALAMMGLGIGMCWPHLGSAVFASAPEDERNLASASITTVVMLGNAFGSAVAGMVTNLAGIGEPARAAQFVFGLFIVAPLLALLLMRRVRGS